jgi:hypothetical protein
VASVRIVNNRACSFARIALFSLVFLVSGHQLLAQKNTNLSSKLKSGIFLGAGNVILSNSARSFIGAGSANTISNSGFNPASTNTINQDAVIVGGFRNTNSGLRAFIGGGEVNKAANSWSVASGGFGNVANGSLSAIGGGSGNLASGFNSVVSGGELNTAGENYSAVGGGRNNAASGLDSTVSGGGSNVASGHYSTVSGGSNNTASAENATIGGGEGNLASVTYATVGGGFQNQSSGNSATAAGGYQNWAKGDYSFVAGGYSNTAGSLSFAAGNLANATNTYAFVWGGADVATTSTNSQSFTVRSPGGARFLTATSIVGVILAPNATAWAALSDSNAKTDIQPVDAREVLRKVAALPVTSWHYKHDLQRRYIGPMAQDFHAAFGLGSDDKTITTLDTDGVTLAAIQGLMEELHERDAKIAKLEDALRQVNERLDKLPPAP